jgi:D-Tyr-tRNAtyr deacylase
MLRKSPQSGAASFFLLASPKGDDQATSGKMVDKIMKLRIFPDENGKTNLSLADVREWADPFGQPVHPLWRA